MLAMNNTLSIKQHLLYILLSNFSKTFQLDVTINLLQIFRRRRLVFALHNSISLLLLLPAVVANHARQRTS